MTPKKYLCPKCKAEAGIKIVYGYPGNELIEKSFRGEIALGGCSISEENQHNRVCTQCEFKWSTDEIEDGTWIK
jgi:hypothetical protein